MHRKLVRAVSEVPYYMSAVGMQGARFIVDDPHGGVPDPAPKDDPKPEGGEDPKPADDLGGFKSQESKDAVLADLAKAREQLKKFEEAQAEAEKAKLSDIERAKTEAEEARAELAKVQAESARYRIAAKHGLTDEADLELLASVTDEEAMERLAARIAVPSTPGTPKPDMSGGAKHEATGTIAEQIAAAEKSGDKARVAALKAQQLGELASKLK